MTRNTAQALLIPGAALLTLAGVLVPFETVADDLSALGLQARLASIAPVAALIMAFVALAGVILWHKPRGRFARLYGAAACGALAALLVAVAAPQWLAGAASPVALLR